MTTMSMATRRSLSVAIGMKEKTNISLTRQEYKNFQQQQDKDSEKNVKCHSAEEVRDLIIKEFDSQVLILKVRSSDLCEESNHKKILMDLHVPPTTNENVKSTNGTEVVETLDNGLESKDIESWIKTVQVRERDTNMICFAWQNKKQQMLAKAFPLNISIDATHKTCVIANLCLLTITAKDSLGYTNVLLRMWIPNQKTWMFRFVLEYVIPTMIGSSYCKLVQAIISDGDPQLIKCIEGAIVKIYKNAIQIPCTWHLVERSMNGASTNFVAKKHVSKYWKEWFLRFFQTWLYSFMRPNGGINSEEEYNVSKCILLGVINSDAMKEYFTKDGIQHLNTFLTEKIFVYEGVYASYLRNKLFNWEVHSNSAHEGTNSAIKHNSNPVSPNDSLGFATYKMAKYDELLMHERERQIQNEYMKTKLFSVQWKNLTTNAIGIVENQKQRSERCHVRWHKVDECFYCIETVSDDIEEGKFKSSMSSATSSSSSLSSSRTDEDNNILPNTKSKNITKKELQNLSGEELTRRMTSSEREMVECIKGKSKGSSKYDKLKIPKFKRSWKLK